MNSEVIKTSIIRLKECSAIWQESSAIRDFVDKDGESMSLAIERNEEHAKIHN